MRDQRFPVVLAGNCNSYVGTLAGLETDRAGVSWFDAHGDFNTPETTTTGFLDGMGLAMASGRCWKAMPETIAWFQVQMHIGKLNCLTEGMAKNSEFRKMGPP